MDARENTGVYIDVYMSISPLVDLIERWCESNIGLYGDKWSWRFNHYDRQVLYISDHTAAVAFRLTFGL